MNSKNNQPLTTLVSPEKIMIGFLIFGGIYRMMGWPNSHRIMAGSLIGFALIYLIQFFNNPSKTRLGYFTVIALLIGVANGIVSIYYLPHAHIYQMLALLCGFVWLGLEVYNFMKSGKIKRQETWRYLIKDGLYVAAFGITGLGVISKIMHWPGAGLLIIVGLSIGALWAIQSGAFRSK
jgi:hypothetical protein